MTTYGWDASHYDGVLTLVDLQRAHSEGIEFFTHKLGEGLGGEDTTQGTALAAARDAGIKIIGGYWFCHGEDDPVAEATKFVAMADKDEPWWRTFEGWFWQTDAETETGHTKPSKSWIQKFSDELDRLTKRVIVTYASHGQYGDSLTGLTYPLWNANYPSSAQKPFKELYPGDSYPGWSEYSGQVPVFCQYASSATIAGKTTCDANAFRGTFADLEKFIIGSSGGGDIPVSTPTTTDNVGPAVINADGQITNPSFRTDSPQHVPPGTNQYVTVGDMLEIIAYEANVAHTNTTSLGVKADALAEQVTAITATLAQILAIVSGESQTIGGDLQVTGTLHVVEVPPTPVPPQAQTAPSP